MGTVLGRFVKVMTFTLVLALLGPVLIVAVLYLITGSAPDFGKINAGSSRASSARSACGSP